jgi:hypothetical protein
MPKILARAIVIAALTLGSQIVAPAGAQVEPTPADAGISDAELERRIRFIEGRLDASRLHGQIWYWSWMTINAGSAVALGVQAGLIDNHDDKVNSATNAALGAIGVADLLFRPLEVRHGADSIRALPDATRADKIAKLRAAEDRLRRTAERADERTSPMLYGATAALSGVAGSVVGVWGNPSDGVITGLSSLAGGVLNLLTQPAAPARDWRDYQALIGGRADLTRVDFELGALADGGARIGVRVQW